MDRTALSRRGVIATALGAVSAGVFTAASEAGMPGRTPPREPRDRLTAASVPTSAPTPETTPEPVVRAELPRGGRILFPIHRLVGYCGYPGSAALGRLGVGDIDDRVSELERLGAAYARGRAVLPVLELIAVVAQSLPGRDGRYRTRVDSDVVRDYLDAARRHRALLLLNVQPGRARFLDEVRALDRWLREPDVGLALDPEWAVGRGQVPGRVYGRTSGAELNAVAAHLARMVAAGDLPEKVMVVHQLAPRIIRDLSALRPHPGVVAVKSVDGIGPPAAKIHTWQRLITELPAGMRPGFKLFLEEDSAGPSRLMTAGEVMALRPVPDYVMYE